jgi:SAM-dependent methyltransferase
MQKRKLNELYDESFYAYQVDGSVRSARLILARLFEVFRPQSVADFGCGRGSWLAASESLGASKLHGFDGPWVEPGRLLSKQIVFTPVDMGGEIELPTRYDLAISVEVAEHLPAGRAAAFVRTLCRAADVVVFGAAIPYQQGVGHINEQPPSYWIRLFEDNGYDLYDIFREHAWQNSEVAWWYAQNTLLFINRRGSQSLPDRERLILMESAITDAVHPRLLAHYANLIEHPPSFRFCLGQLKRFVRDRVFRRKFTQG